MSATTYFVAHLGVKRWGFFDAHGIGAPGNCMFLGGENPQVSLLTWSTKTSGPRIRLCGPWATNTRHGASQAGRIPLYFWWQDALDSRVTSKPGRGAQVV